MNGKVFSKPKARSGLLTSKKIYCISKRNNRSYGSSWAVVPKLIAMWLTKLLKRPALPGKVKITGKRVSKSVGIVSHYLPCEQGFLHRTLRFERVLSLSVAYRSVQWEKPLLAWWELPCEFIFKGKRFHVTS